MVERHEGSAAPAYPSELAEGGVEGLVRATYVVDATGRVDTSTIRIISSDHPRFTTSVQTSLGEMRFRPAKRRGKPVRQLVAQRFRFQIGRSAQIAPHAGWARAEDRWCLIFAVDMWSMCKPGEKKFWYLRGGAPTPMLALRVEY